MTTAASVSLTMRLMSSQISACEVASFSSTPGVVRA